MPICGWLLALSLAALTGNIVAANERTERNCSLTPPYIPSTAVNTTLRLQELREKMLPLNISAYIIPGTDAHLSEYIAPRDNRLAFMTGFTGSAGTAVVTQTKAAMWTDSRYWVQAERQMDCNWALEKDVSVASVVDWLLAEVPHGGQIGFDPFLFAISKSTSLRSPSLLSVEVSVNRALTQADGELSMGPPDAINAYISTERSWQMKVEHIRNQMADNPYDSTALLLSALDESAWLFNMRGNDIPYNPFFYSYTLLTMDEIWLFLHTERVTDELKVYLNASCNGPLCVQLKSYDTILGELKKFVAKPGCKVWIGTEYTNYAVVEVITQEKLFTSSYSPVLLTKAVKDETEQRVLRDAHVRDAVAVVQLLMWLENAVPKGTETELTAAHYVDKSERLMIFHLLSITTLKSNGFLFVFCSPTNETCRRLTVDEMYLVDSGGQYLDGTTDITRTVHWGIPTAMQKEAFTRVLMGNIEISRTIFPSDTRGINIEMLGRRALWEVGLNYGHGTGHGVGNYFGVHEWPVGFQSNNIPFRAGMFTSIEPGYYKEDDFGIRIEDVAVTVPAQTKYGNNYLTFDTVSLVPYDKKLIDTSLLSSEQVRLTAASTSFINFFFYC
uniref:X-prolyl aminopeptidase (aminopeptidase P) 2, membrane-bound n=1 Tax=Sphaeramia orbicularis TaxID=375764 RepID=A0A672YGY3_9TELE